MSKYLLVFDRDWADEFQCESYSIHETEESAQATVDQYINNESYFGTNEGFEAGELSEEDFSITEISTGDVEVLRRLLGNSFGTGLK